MPLSNIPAKITDAANRPIAGGKVFFYLAGSTTLATVYADVQRAVPLPNPVLADAAGLLPAIHLNPSLRYDIAYADADAEGPPASPIFFADSVSGGSFLVRPLKGVAGPSYTVLPGDGGLTVHRSFPGDMADTLPAPAAAGIGNGFTVEIWNGATEFNVTVTASGGALINGQSALVIYPGQRVTFRSNGGSYDAPVIPLDTGPQTMPILVGALKPSATNGASPGSFETATHKVNVETLDFDHATTEYAETRFPLPLGYDGGPIAVRFAYVVATGTGSLRWGAQAGCVVDGQSIDSEWGAPGEIADAVLGVSPIEQRTAWVNFTPANALGGRMCAFRFYRKGGVGSHDADARLTGLELRWSRHRGNDA